MNDCEEPWHYLFVFKSTSGHGWYAYCTNESLTLTKRPLEYGRIFWFPTWKQALNEGIFMLEVHQKLTGCGCKKLVKT